MLRETSVNQHSFDLGGFRGIYDILIPADNELRRMNEEIDFGFVYDLLKGYYSADMGRPAIGVVRMFKLLLLKARDKMSDRGLIKRLRTDLEYKFFLGMDPEDTDLPDPSTLSKFRRGRLGDGEGQRLIDTAIGVTVGKALELGIIKDRSVLIVDSTHTHSMFKSVAPRDALIKAGKALRKKVYSVDPSLKGIMPAKREASGLLEDQMEYTRELIEAVEGKAAHALVVAQEELDALKETLEDTQERLDFSKEEDARTGHKSRDSSFFGYKSHIGISPEGIILSAVVTSGEATDGKQLEALIGKAEEAGVTVEAAVGDAAYSEAANISYCEGHKDSGGNDAPILLASKLSETVTHGMHKDQWDFNKDAGMYVCPQGHMAVRKASSKRGEQEVGTWFFDVGKCKVCPVREGCYKDGAKSRSYSVSLKTPVHTRQMEFMKTSEFKELYSERYKIEQKNSELKGSYGYGQATQVGLTGMDIQSAATFFMSNMRKIFRLTK